MQAQLSFKMRMIRKHSKRNTQAMRHAHGGNYSTLESTKSCLENQFRLTFSCKNIIHYATLNIHTKCAIYLSNRMPQLITRRYISSLDEQA